LTQATLTFETGNPAAIRAEVETATRNGYAVSGARLAELSDDWRGDVRRLRDEGVVIFEKQVGRGWLVSCNENLLKSGM
jgi:hypothetical protein